MEDINSIIAQVENLQSEKTTLINNIQNYSEETLIKDISTFIFNNWDGFDSLSHAMKFVSSLNTLFNSIAKDCSFFSNDCDDFLFKFYDEYTKDDDIGKLREAKDFENYMKKSDASRELLRLNQKYSTAKTHNHDKTLKSILNSISQDFDLEKIKIKNSSSKYIDFEGLCISCGNSYADINWRLSKQQVMYSLNEQGRSQISELISSVIGYKIRYFELLQANNVESMITELLNDISLFDVDNVEHLAIKSHPLYHD